MVDSSGWVQWVLQVIPVAVIAGAAAAFIFREIEAWRARKRELKGLLRLLSVEIEYNEQMLEFFAQVPSAIGDLAEGAGLQTGAWKENRGRIAELIEHGEDFQCLADYFMNVAVFEKERLEGQRKEEVLPQHIPLLLDQGMDAKQVVAKVVGAKVEPQVEGLALEAPKDAN